MEQNILIGQRLLEWFDGRKQNVMCSRLGVTQAAMSRVINGKRAIDANMLISLAKAGCDINWLLTGKSINK